jgi:hypothetical protein
MIVSHSLLMAAFPLVGFESFIHFEDFHDRLIWTSEHHFVRVELKFHSQLAETAVMDAAKSGPFEQTVSDECVDQSPSI